MDQRKIGAFIAQLRKEKGLTQEQLAESLNVSNKSVSRWETGNGLPDIVVMGEVCKFFDVSMDELVKGERAGATQKKKGAIIIIIALILIIVILLWILFPDKNEGNTYTPSPSVTPNLTAPNKITLTPFIESTTVAPETNTPSETTETPTAILTETPLITETPPTPESVSTPNSQIIIYVTPAPTSAPTSTPEITQKPTVNATATSIIKSTPTPTVKPTPTPTPTPTAKPTPTPTAKPTPTPTPTAKPLATPDYTHVLSSGGTLTFSKDNDIVKTFVRPENNKWDVVGSRFEGNYDIVTDGGERVMQYTSNATWRAPILLPSITKAIFSHGAGTYVLEFDVKVTASPNEKVASFMTLAFFYKERDYSVWGTERYKNVLKNVYNLKGNYAIAGKCLNVDLSDAQLGQWYHCKCEFIFSDELENIMRTTDMFFGSYSTGHLGVTYLFDNFSIRKN